MPIAAAPTKPLIQIRPLSQMQQSESPILKKPQVSYTCSFCNAKQSTQPELIKHLNQHVNFSGSSPNPADLEKGYWNFKIQNSQSGLWKTKFMCLSCGKMFAKDGQVKIHLNVHYGDNIYNCRFCEKVFANYNTFEEHVKSHSEEYKFHCKFCNASFINRNVMVTHQRTCPFSTDTDQPGAGEKRASLEITPVSEPKKLRIVLNGESLKEFVMSKNDSETSSTPTQLTVVPVIAQHQNNNNQLTEAGQNAVVKQVVRKRAPIFPFEPEDHYVPDNNSNNIIPKNDINPPPTAVERKQGYCLRPFRETGQQRYICTVCGKHYTTMYNMRQHRNIHTGSGLHSCRYCGRSFTHKHVWEVRISYVISTMHGFCTASILF